MSYNLANQMTAANGFSFTYDGFNRRVKSAKSGSTAYYHYSQDGKLLFSESNGVWKNYIYIGSRLIAKDSSSSASFIHTDILGSTTAQSNNSGTLINNSRRHYKPFGDTYETASNEIGYAGHKFDSELGLSYMQARYYDPVIGRFYSNDPVTGNAIDAATFGWTFELILVMWLWTIFWGNAFIVQDRDHVTFDIFYNTASPRARSVMGIIGAVIIVVALWASIGPTYDRMQILRLKSSATLPVKMLPIYSIYFLFLAAVGLRYLWRAIDIARHGADKDLHVLPYVTSVRDGDLK